MSKKNPKVKKGHKGLIIFLIIFGILVVFPVGFLFGAFFDTSTKDVSNKSVTYENIVSQAFHNGIKNLDKEDPKLNFTIDESMVDGIMMGACDKINLKNFIPKMYCYIKDNNYTFVMDAQASFFKTRVLLYTTLENEGKGLEETLVFKITGVTVGRLPIPINWVTGILDNFISDEMLNNAFGQSGFHIQSHLSEAKLTYSREQFKSDIGDYLNNLGNDNPFLNILLTIFGCEDGDHPVLNTGYKDGITVSLDLGQLEADGYSEPLKFNELDKHKKAITEWLNASYIKEDEVETLFNYLIRGYEDNKEKYIEGLDNYLKKELIGHLDELGHEEVRAENGLKEYKGSYAIEKKPFKECGGDMNASLTCETTSQPYKAIFALDINSINKYLISNMTEAIGKTIPITNVNADGSWNFDYVVVDNFYVNFIDDKQNNPDMEVYLNMNISGIPATLKVISGDIKITGTDPGTSETDWTLGKLSFRLKDIYFGKIKLTDEKYKNDILSMLPSGSEGNEYFTYDSENKKFEIDIDSLGSESETTTVHTTLASLDSNVRIAILTAIKSASEGIGDIGRKVENNEFKISYATPTS